MEIGLRIRELREQRCWSQEQDWRFRRYVIERLDVQAVLSGTGAGRVAAMTCVIGAVHCAAVHSCSAAQ